MHRRRRLAGWAAALLLLAACSGGPTPDAGVPATGATGAAQTPGGGTGSPTAAATASPTPTVTLPGSCPELVSTARVRAALGRGLPREADYLYAGPLPDSGRTGRVTCGYGRPDAAGRPMVEISRIAYVDAATAADRIQLTVATARDDGDAVRRQGVADLDGYVLRSREEADLVFADGAQTFVVTIRRGVVPGPAVRSALDGIATAVLEVKRREPGGG